MSSVPRIPSRGNWMWLASGLLTVTVLTGAAFRYGNAGCPVTGRGLTAGAAGRVAAAAPARAASQAKGAARPAGGGARTAGVAPGPGGRARARAGVAVYYDPGNAVGSCSLGPFPAGGHYVSLPPRAYAGGAACGTYLEVRGPRGQVKAKVVDLCPGCAASMINLSRAAFARVAAPGPGSARVRYWPVVDPPLPGPIVVRAGENAAGKLTLQILNTGNRLASVTLTPARVGGPAGARDPLSLGRHGLWVSGERLGAGPFTVRITDNRRHQAVIFAAMLHPGRVIRTRTWMYTTGPAGAHHTSGTGAALAGGPGQASSPTKVRSPADRPAAPGQTAPAGASC